MKTYIIAFDIESTGTNTVTDRIVQLAMVKCKLSDLAVLRKKLLCLILVISIHQKLCRTWITDEMLKFSNI